MLITIILMTLALQKELLSNGESLIYTKFPLPISFLPEAGKREGDQGGG
jgi:hypothetical protein